MLNPTGKWAVGVANQIVVHYKTPPLNTPNLVAYVADLSGNGFSQINTTFTQLDVDLYYMEHTFLTKGTYFVKIDDLANTDFEAIVVKIEVTDYQEVANAVYNAVIGAINTNRYDILNALQLHDADIKAAIADVLSKQRMKVVL